MDNNFKIFFIIFCFTLEPVLSLDFKKNSCTKIISYHTADISDDCVYNPDVLSNVIDASRRRGYDVETHTFTTDDGYILNLFRITNQSVEINKNPVLLQHGIAANSYSWTDYGHRSLAFQVADRGHEAWIGNLRGSIYSIENKFLNATDPDYWNYNLDIITENDMRGQIKYVYEQTNQKIIVLGHSMGTTLSFMYASAFAEEANERIQGIVALAPVVYLDGAPLIEFLSPLVKPILLALNDVDINHFFYPEDEFHEFTVNFCNDAAPEICYLLMSTVSGYTSRLNPDVMPIFFSFWGSGTSSYQLLQFLQICDSGRFQKYDYGEETNLKMYGTPIPPVYNLTAVQVPVSLFYGTHDVFYTKKNIERLYNEIGSTDKHVHSVPYSHIDFLVARDLITELYSIMFTDETSL